jgi:hypothetical protein
MTLYRIALFVHVVGALLLFATLTVEGIGLRSLRRATTIDQARDGSSVARLTRVVGPSSALAILVPGLYMTASTWGWVAWIVMGLAGWLLIAVLGAVSGIRLTAVARAATEQGLAARERDARPQLRDPLFVASWLTRVALALGIVFLMTYKPNLEGALLALAAAAATGVGASALVWPHNGTREVAPLRMSR